MSDMRLRQWEYAGALSARLPRVPGRSKCSTRGAKAMADIRPLAPLAFDAERTGKTLDAAQSWSVPGTPPAFQEPELSQASRTSFFGRLTGADIEAELQRQAVLLKGLLRDMAVVRDTVWHLADERSFLPAAAQDAKEAIDTAAELRAKIHELDAKVQSLPVSQKDAADTVREDGVVPMKANDASLQALGSLDTHYEDSYELENRLEELRRVLDGRIEESSRKLERQLQEHRQEHSGAMSRLEENHRGLEARLKEHSSALHQRLEEHRQEHSGAMSRLEENHRGLEARLKEHRQEHSGAMSRLEENHRGLEARLKELRSPEDLRVKVAGLEEEFKVHRRQAGASGVIRSISACVAEEVSGRACESITPMLQRLASEARDRPSTSPAVLQGKPAELEQEVASQVARELVLMVMDALAADTALALSPVRRAEWELTEMRTPSPVPDWSRRCGNFGICISDYFL
ncbi:unnamed protein product [Effrenium voratum]|uniref:Uncharacterized protein n=1 Tax=Effrenium voratum TaxID=2562239 RepID=A0AA36JHD8_9DINO|nr:unnamed protein product [Effrenium voratum]